MYRCRCGKEEKHQVYCRDGVLEKEEGRRSRMREGEGDRDGRVQNKYLEKERQDRLCLRTVISVEVEGRAFN